MNRFTSLLKNAAILVLITFFSLNYFLFNDTPQAFESQLIRKFKIQTEQIEFLYSIFAFVNLFTGPIGGIISNRMGYIYSTLVYSVFSSFGCFITYFAFLNGKFKWMIIGRIFFAFWTESSFMNATACLEETFRGSGNSISFSAAFMIYGLVQSLSNTYLPNIYLKKRSLAAPFFVAAIFSTFQFFSCVIYYIFFYKKKFVENSVRSNLVLETSFCFFFGK